VCESLNGDRMRRNDVRPANLIRNLQAVCCFAQAMHRVRFDGVGIVEERRPGPQGVEEVRPKGPGVSDQNGEGLRVAEVGQARMWLDGFVVPANLQEGRQVETGSATAVRQALREIGPAPTRLRHAGFAP
jgi:hypothetical protein